MSSAKSEYCAGGELVKRREFLERLARVTGSIVLMPAVSVCSNTPAQRSDTKSHASAESTSGAESAPVLEVPLVQPDDWDAISFNRTRGNQGAIPQSYWPSINGPDGEKSHLGKHLPYFPQMKGLAVPQGYLALMWGDPDKGYTRHPNAPKNESNQHQGHWYNWIRIRKATERTAIQLQSEYTNWPETETQDNGAYAVLGGGDITADSGKNTIYVVALPEDVKAGDQIRIHAHCLTHGEYVDFLTLT